MHILVNPDEEASKALKIFEKASVDGANLFAFVTQNELGTCRFVRTSVQAFHEQGRQTAGEPKSFQAQIQENFNKNKAHLIEFIGNKFNILFYNGAAVFYHRTHIDDFIKNCLL